MLKIIHRYVLREFTESFLFGLIVFSSILLLDQVFQLVDLFLSKGIALPIIARLFLLILPNILSLTIPMAVLLGILLSYGRLSEDNEITSFRSSGLPYRAFTGPVVWMILILSVFLVYFNQTISPATHNQFRMLYKDILNQHPLIKFDDKAIVTVGEYKVYVEHVDKESNVLHGINIYKFSSSEHGAPWRISASSAAVDVSPHAVLFHLSNGFWQQPNPEKLDTLVHMQYKSYLFAIPIGGQVIPFSQSLREMTGTQLLKEIDSYRAKNMPTHFLETEYWMRWALAFSPIVLALCGIPLGIVLEKGGRAIGFGVSLGMLFVYYLLLVTGLNISEKGYVQPGFILFLPNIVMLIVGLLLWRRMVKK